MPRSFTLVLAWSAIAQDRREQEMRAKVLGIGQGLMVEVRLSAGGKLTGRIGEIRDGDFVLEGHTHPRGQTLIVTAGCGWVQRAGGPIEEIRPGDVVWFPPGEKHWHGDTATTGMTHIGIQEKLNGKAVDWMEHVTDEQYRSGGQR